MNLTQEEFGSPLGLSWFNVRDLESGKKKVTPQLAEELEKNYSINMRWLLTGDGEMFRPDEHTLPNGVDIYPSPRVHRTESGLFAVADMVYVPMSTMTACCGEGFVVYPQDCDINESVVVHNRDLGAIISGQLPFAVRTEGRSMEGYGIKEGSIVIVNPAEQTPSGSVVMVIINERAAIKKIYERADGLDFTAASGERLHVSRDELNDDGYVRICGKVMLVITPPDHGV